MSKKPKGLQYKGDYHTNPDRLPYDGMTKDDQPQEPTTSESEVPHIQNDDILNVEEPSPLNYWKPSAYQVRYERKDAVPTNEEIHEGLAEYLAKVGAGELANMLTQEEEPNLSEVGLINKYIVTHADGTPTNKGAQYFVLRIDSLQKDANHYNACMAALQEYANAIKEHLPALADDLNTKYIYPWSDNKLAKARRKAEPNKPVWDATYKQASRSTFNEVTTNTIGYINDPYSKENDKLPTW